MADSKLWTRAREAFDRLADAAPEKRRAELEALEAGDPDLAQLVIELLDAHDEAGPVDQLDDGDAKTPGLMASLQDVVHGRLASAGMAGAALVEPEPGETVGGFEILGKLGEGGMATVYRARRSTDDFRQEVALKILAPHRLTVHGLARFQLERQLAASLDHPHIAKLVDGGLTDDGRPFFALELVEGVPIDVFCERGRLTLEDRLRLMIDVARAVHHAHKQLVVHRDLKPSNVMVGELAAAPHSEDTAAGRVKLVDFGIAKILSADDDSRQATRTLERVMTPQYASPEQFLGRPVGVASDIYQLGLLLYQLLAGDLPYRLEGLNPAEQQRVICDTPPSRPSSQASPDSPSGALGGAPPAPWRSRLSGDLDSIVLKALRKEPERRYGSAEQLAEDLERFVDGRPVLATRQTWSYVAGKFLRRHRAAVALVTATLLTVMAVGTYAALRVFDERDRAEQALEESRAVTDYLTDIFKASDPNRRPGEDATASELLARGLERVGELGEEPGVQAQVLAVIGEVYAERQEYDKATEALERSWQLRREVAGDEHPEIARVLSTLGSVLRRLDRIETAEKVLREAVRQHRIFADGPNIDLAQALNNLGVLLSNRGYELFQAESPEADRLFNEASELLQETVDILEVLEPESRNAATVLGNVGSLYNRRGDHEQAIHFNRRALEHHLRLGRVHPRTARVAMNLALNLNRADRHEESLEMAEMALEIRQEIFGETHRATLEVLRIKGMALDELGRFEQAVDIQRRYAEGTRELFGSSHQETADAYSSLAYRLLAAGELGEAEQWARRALDIRRPEFEQLDDRARARLYYQWRALGAVLEQAGEKGEAIESYEQSLIDAPADERPGIERALAALRAL